MMTICFYYLNKAIVAHRVCLLSLFIAIMMMIAVVNVSTSI